MSAPSQIQPTVTRARGRPRRILSDAAMDAAVRLFWARGYDGATVDALSRAMNVPLAILYQRHGDKHGLFLAAIRHYARTRLAPLAERLGPRGTLRDDLSAFFDGVVTLATSDPHTRGCLISCVLAETAGSSETLRAELERRFGLLEGHIAARLRADAPGSPAEAHAPRAMLIASIARGLMLRARAGASRQDLSAAAAVAIDLLAPKTRD